MLYLIFVIYVSSDMITQTIFTLTRAHFIPMSEYVITIVPCAVRGGGGRVRAADPRVLQLPAAAGVGSVLRRRRARPRAPAPRRRPRQHGRGRRLVRAPLSHPLRALPQGVPVRGRARRMFLRSRRLARARHRLLHARRPALHSLAAILIPMDRE